MVTAGMTPESSVALKLGASGIFLKDNSPASLATAIRLVMSGEMWVDQKVIQLMADQVQQGGGIGQPRAVAHREGTQVLQGVFEGLAKKEIAARLGVTEGVVKATLQQLFQKTQVRTRSQLVRIALEGSLGTLRGR
jgi:DNA-binding NarL/FixJ family response regulator